MAEQKQSNYGTDIMNKEILDDNSIEKAVDYLRDSAEPSAQATANRKYLEEYRKAKKSLLMKKHLTLAISAQEREAYADPEYVELILGLKQAIYEDEKQKHLRVAAEAKIEAWRTKQANLRAIKL